MTAHHDRARTVEKAPWVLETFGVLLLLFNMLLSGVLAPSHVESASEVFGRILAPLFLGLIVVGLFNLAPGTRNRRSRAKIFLGTMCFVLLGSCGRIMSRATEQRPASTGAMTEDLELPALRQLEQAGSDLTKPHPIQFYLYFPTEQAAQSAAERISAMDFDTEFERAADGSAWLCTTTRSMVPDHGALVEIRQQFDAVATDLGGEYDGWATPIVE